MRTQKQVGSKVTDYYYDSNNNLIAEKTDSATLFFYYDTENSPIALSYNGKMFYYVKNLQGDIVKILDEDGQEKADYVYNAWGDIISQSDDELSSINPLRYRGYVYDEDTTMYYLQTRYYDPTTGRFINADGTAFIGSSGTAIGDNIYTYCENDPVNRSDAEGTCYFDIKDNIKHFNSEYRLDFYKDWRKKERKYNRKFAVNYARRWAYLRNNQYPWFIRGDCTNFVSQCLHAGGILMNDDWFYLYSARNKKWKHSNYWSVASQNMAYFYRSKYVRKHKSFNLHKTNMSSQINIIKKYNIKSGDLLYFDFDGDGVYTHAAIISSVNAGIKYCVHTKKQKRLSSLQ